jgi:hypothetical protein
VKPHTALLASAVRLPIVKQGYVTTKTEAWQDEAARLYDVLGELRFVANWVGQILSRAELRSAIGNPPTVTEEGPAADAVADYFGGWQGQQEMLNETGVHFTVTGECYHVYRNSEKKWRVLGYNRVKQQGNKAMADFGDGEGFVELSKGTDLIIRLWVPHPFDPEQADSPTRSNIQTLREIERCNLHIQATLTSRLAGAGVFFVPDEITFPAPADAPENATDADLFMQTLGEAMLAPIGDPGQPSAVVPIVVKAPGEYLGNIRHQTFWTELSDSILTTREAAIKRFALGMDVPPEVLTGMAETNHWNAWLVDEAAVKAHIEPRLQVITNAITTAYLWPALEGVVPDPQNNAVVGDSSQIRMRPNRSSEAIELFDRGILNEAATRRETGFDEADAPDDTERASFLLRKVAQAASSPEQAAAAAELLGIPLPVAGDRQEQPDNLASPDRREDPRNRREPDIERSMDRVASGLLAACDALVYRALERAGNRLKSAHNYTGKTLACDVYLELQANPRNLDVLFADCWTPLPRIIGRFTTDVDVVRVALDTYCKTLVREQVPHDHLSLEHVLASALGSSTLSPN